MPTGVQKTEDLESVMEEDGLNAPLKLSSDENECDSPGPANLEKNEFENSPKDNNQGTSLRPRREKLRAEYSSARKSIGKSTNSQKNSPAAPSATNIKVSPTTKTAKVPLKNAADSSPSIKPRRKRRYKGGTYSLYLSKKKKPKPLLKQLKKDWKEGDEEEYDSEDENVSLTDSMMTLDSSHEDDAESMNPSEEAENSELNLQFQDDDDMSETAEDQILENEVEPVSEEANNADAVEDDPEVEEAAEAIEEDGFKELNGDADVAVAVDDVEEDLGKEDTDENAPDNASEPNSSIDKSNNVNDASECDSAAENDISECDNNGNNSEIVCDVKDVNKIDAVDNYVSSEVNEKTDLKIETDAEIKDESVTEAVKNEAVVEEVAEEKPKEVKKPPIKLVLRPAFKSLLKAGSKATQNDDDKSSVVANGNLESKSVTPEPSKVEEVDADDSEVKNGTTNESDNADDDINSDDGSNDPLRLVMSESADVDDGTADTDESFPALDENENMPESNKDTDMSIEIINIDSPSLLGENRKSSIASGVKSRQRIKRKVMEDHVDVDSVSISSLQSEPDNILAKRLKGLDHATGMNGNDSSMPIINGTSPVVPAKPPMTQSGSFLKKVTTCLCAVKSTVTQPFDAWVEKSPNGIPYCQAVDAMYGRIVACCNVVSVKHVQRPSVRIPFMFMCELHRHRLRLHQCCPGCGLFCTEGVVFQCRSQPKAIHHFHKRCLINVNNSQLCPHCGVESQLQEVKLELNTPQPLNFYLSRYPVYKFPRAKIEFNSSSNNASSKKAEIDRNRLTPSKSYKVARSNKIISSSGLPLGPERDDLEMMLSSLKEEDLVNLRYTQENMLAVIESGDSMKVLHMIASGLDPNCRFEEYNNDTYLHMACRLGYLTIVHILIQSGAAIDIFNNSLKPPMFCAIEAGHLNVVNHLIVAGADLNIKGEDGTTALHVACVLNKYEICELILNAGVKPNKYDDGGWTPMVWAAEHGLLNIVKLLLERGADPYLRDNEQNIALHWAAFSGSVDISQLFLDRGCPINSININGDTPLHIAARQEKYECVVLFLARQADVNAKNSQNELPIDSCLNKDSQTWMALSMSNELRKLKPASGDERRTSDVVIYRDISQGKENYPIQCINGYDNEQIPTNYLYVIQNCETTPINIDRTITSLQSCSCEDDCTSSGCKCVQISLKCWYDKEGKLLPDFNFLDPPMLFECNRACRCWKNMCNNRVVQDGITCRLQLFRTKDKGWGVRSLKDIPRGSFVCEYIGELISDIEADQREDDSYLFDLDNRDGETFCIDARYYGNISRFINHLCEPNVVPVKVFIDHQDLSFPRIAFFSSRHIKAYEELGFDYGEKFWMIKYKWFTCTCESPKCKYSKDSIHTTLENYNRRMKEDKLNDLVKKASTVVDDQPPVLIINK